jgi:hypothetical protein
MLGTHELETDPPKDGATRVSHLQVSILLQSLGEVAVRYAYSNSLILHKASPQS